MSNANVVAVVPRRRPIFARTNVNPQLSITIPDPIFYEMVRNPKFKKVWHKLRQSCKYPFSKNKLVLCGIMILEGNEFKIGQYFDSLLNLDWNNNTCNFWVTGCLYLIDPVIDMKLLSSAVYRSEVGELKIGVNLDYSFYQKLASSSDLEVLWIWGKVRHGNGSEASPEQLLDHLSKLRILYWHFYRNTSIKSAKDVQKFYQSLSNLKKMGTVFVCDLPEKLFPAFVEIFKNNKTIDFQLAEFRHKSANYERMIEAFCKEVLENPIDKIPRICYGDPIIDEDWSKEYEEMWSLSMVRN